MVCNGLLSTIQYLQFGVPQGSVLGPILFVMYTAELSHVVAQHDLKFHQYADECQICFYAGECRSQSHRPVLMWFRRRGGVDDSQPAPFEC